jgi:hypothetical protein
MTAAKRPRKGNPVAEAVEKVGGPIEAAAICRVTTTAVYRWLRVGRIRDAIPCLKLAKASGVPPEALANL